MTMEEAMIRCRTTAVLSMARTAIAVACLLAASGGDDDGGGPTPVPTAPKASPTRASTAPPTGTSTAVVAVPTATASPTRTTSAAEFAGEYSSTIALEGAEEAHLDLTVGADASATGTLEIVEVSAA